MSSIDWGTMALGAIVGIGCRKQLTAAGRVAAEAAASLAGVAAEAAQQVAEAGSKSAEEVAEERMRRIDQQIAGQNV